MKIKFIIVYLLLVILGSQVFSREVIIEDFETGEIELYSYEEEDEEPDDWTLDSTNTFDNTDYSLKIYGNTWKQKFISGIEIDSNSVWQVAAFSQSDSEIQGFGLSDGDNLLFYSLFGTEELNIEEFITVYQGAFTSEEWQIFELPVGNDWLAWYDQLSTITSIIFINDFDEDRLPGTVYFDEIYDITEDLSLKPQVNVSYEINSIQKRHNAKDVAVQFYAEINDADSDVFTYLWNFNDGSISNIPEPQHTFTITDNHAYSILLEVVDETGNKGYDTCQIEVDEGETSLPAVLNFVGDIMLGRNFEDSDGIIPNQGVEAIFEPTLPYLGMDAEITIANMECPLTDEGEHHPTKPIYFRSSPDNVAGLVYGGIDIVTLANNHSLDYGLAGLEQTINVLEENNVFVSGAGQDSYEAYLPLFYQHDGLTFSFLASSDRTGQYNNYQPYLNAGFNKPGFAYMTPYYVREQINEVKEIADFIIIETHSGSEYSTGPTHDYDKLDIDMENFSEDEDFNPLIDIPHMWDREIRHFFVDEGADLVINHHPHIIQGLEVYNGKLIAHSLGNFVFDLSYPETFPSMILKAYADNHNFYQYEIIPVFIDDYIPRRAENQLGLYILDYLAMKSKELNTYLDIDREQVIANVVMDTTNMNIQYADFQKILTTEENQQYYYTKPVRLEREGYISNINNILPASNWQYRVGKELVWFGNCEDEGATMWNLNSDDEWYDDEEAYSGSRSICHRRFPDSYDNIVTNFTGKLIKRDDVAYSLHGCIKTQNGADVTIEIEYYENRYDNYYIERENIGIELNGDNNWNYYTKMLNVPPETNFFDIRVNSDLPENDEALSWFDDVGIIAWTEWQDFNNDNNISAPNNYYYIQLKTDENFNFCSLNYRESIFGETSISEPDNQTGANKKAILMDNYPNPFNPETTIYFKKYAETQNLIINIFNIKGQKVKAIQVENPDLNYVIWDGKNKFDKAVASGVYFYQLKCDGKTQDVKKMLLLK